MVEFLDMDFFGVLPRGLGVAPPHLRRMSFR